MWFSMPPWQSFSWRVFDRAMIESPEGLATGVLNNFGDLPFHLSVITSFAYGNNFPPEDPTYAGVHFTYPFLPILCLRFLCVVARVCRESMFIENFVVAVAFFGLLHRWALDLVKDRLAALATPLLVFLSGGFGWVLLWTALKRSDTGLFGALKPCSLGDGNTRHHLALGQRHLHVACPTARDVARIAASSDCVHSMVAV